ncbi:Uncharacterised protein [Vibrio cholerae]|nr:Uncharacterised protein [Vibrio cholerae]
MLTHLLIERHDGFLHRWPAVYINEYCPPHFRKKECSLVVPHSYCGAETRDPQSQDPFHPPALGHVAERTSVATGE